MGKKSAASEQIIDVPAIVETNPNESNLVVRDSKPQVPGKTRISWRMTNTSAIAEFNDIFKSKLEFSLTALYDNYKHLNLIQRTIIFYGLKQKLSDSIARPDDMKLTVEEKAEQMNLVYNRLKEGKWNTQGEGKQSIKKKAAEFAKTADEKQLEMLKKLGLI